jgi:hypothetical protein
MVLVGGAVECSRVEESREIGIDSGGVEEMAGSLYATVQQSGGFQKL